MTQIMQQELFLRLLWEPKFLATRVNHEDRILPSLERVCPSVKRYIEEKWAGEGERQMSTELAQAPRSSNS